MVTVESTGERGATFRFTWPRRVDGAEGAGAA
jgi:hypothetical protein